MFVFIRTAICPLIKNKWINRENKISKKKDFIYRNIISTSFNSENRLNLCISLLKSLDEIHFSIHKSFFSITGISAVESAGTDWLSESLLASIATSRLRNSVKYTYENKMILFSNDNTLHFKSLVFSVLNLL